SSGGVFELARVLSVNGPTITLDAPLTNAFVALHTQMIRVPEFTTVTVSAGGQIQPAPWNGETGGVVAFLANGAVTIGGNGIDASAIGFRGGAATSGQLVTLDSTSLDADPLVTTLNAQKGEGLALDQFGATFVGRGNRLNG